MAHATMGDDHDHDGGTDTNKSGSNDNIDDNTNCDLEKGFNNGDDEVEGGKDNDNKKNDCDDNIGEQLNNAELITPAEQPK